MSEKRLCFSRFRKVHSQQEFIRITTEIAVSYSNSSSKFNYRYYTEHYNISKNCFYKILDYAAIHNFISDEDFERMTKKLLSNQAPHMHDNTNGKYLTSMVTIEKRRKIKEKRIKYIVQNFPNQKAIELTEKLAFFSKEALCKQYNLGKTAFGFIVENTIIKNLVDDTCFNLIKQRSLEVNSSESTVAYFKYLANNRALYKAYYSELCYITKQLATTTIEEDIQVLNIRQEQINFEMKKLFRIC